MSGMPGIEASEAGEGGYFFVFEFDLPHSFVGCILNIGGGAINSAHMNVAHFSGILFGI